MHVHIPDEEHVYVPQPEPPHEPFVAPGEHATHALFRQAGVEPLHVVYERDRDV